ncbi:hypothetical protein LUZ60_012952 [Juncus effusus]|nr:hypothetical protein LUZ60_012952 [Juncus effusus]
MMMTHKKSGFGSSSTRLPASSPVPKIAKGKRSVRRRVDIIQHNDMSAFEMLATLAGNLLTEDSKKPPIIPTEKNETKTENPKPEMVIKSEPLDQDSCNESQKENSPMNIPPLISSDSSAEMPLYKNKIKIARKEIVGDNSGDNSSGCTNSKAFRANSKARVSKKVLCSKYRKPSLTRAHSSSDGEVKRAFCNSKLFYTRQRTQFKKKKQFEVKNEGKKDRVKLSINSFKIPELVIEVSESTTVASLKKRVLEAMAAMLGDGLHIGVALQGQKFKDDNLNLAQAGINQGEKINNLDFSLEPKFKSDPNSSPQLVQEDSHLTDLGDPTEPLTRAPMGSEENPNSDVNPNPLSSPSLNCHESDIEWAPSSPVETNIPSSPENNSKAIVVHQMELDSPVGNNNALAVMSPARKSKRVEPVSQRRIRRPFSVGEVEALVSAVEQLGTGRWRDVKIRAFDNAKHRTYVDLKDKWKTLVHTASIAPQQRRGEPVPQDLLDRVLGAQSYWSTQQAKLQLKDATCLLTQN